MEYHKKDIFLRNDFGGVSVEKIIFLRNSASLLQNSLFVILIKFNLVSFAVILHTTCKHNHQKKRKNSVHPI